MPAIYFTVTTDLSYDQRMIRICNSLAKAGYDVTLVGRKMQHSIPLVSQAYKQKRLNCWFEKGKLFYAEYNLRLFFFMAFKKMDAICAIDLDTILPCYYVSKIKNIKRIYDAHELFCEMKEIVSRPRIYRMWKWIERKTVPHFKYGYTVNRPIAEEFKKMYGSNYEVIRSIAVYHPNDANSHKREKFILYQGAVNEGRSFETLLPAMQWVNAALVICGEGNFLEQAKKMVHEYKLEDKIQFKGALPPIDLKKISNTAYIGLTLFEKGALSNYYSLANRFFDYIHAGVPQLCVDYPVYTEMNNLHEVAVLIDDLDARNIATQLNQLLEDDIKWSRLQQNCREAAKELNWQNEEKRLLAFYKNVFG